MSSTEQRSVSDRPIAEEGDSIYARSLRDRLEPANNGQVVAIDVETEAFEVANTALEAATALKKRKPTARIWLVRIGSRALRHISRSALSSEIQFVADGHERALQVIEGPLLAELRAAVAAEFADRPAAAGPVRRIQLRSAIEREVQRRFSEEMETKAPPGALY